MPVCPACESEYEVPSGESILVDEFLDDIDVDVSVQEHVQLECPECEAILGYLGVAAGVGGDDQIGFQ